MKIEISHRESLRMSAHTAVVFAVITLLFYVPVARSQAVATIVSPTAQGAIQTNIVSDKTGLGAVTVDPNLVNPWGMSFGPTTPYWIADQAKGVSTLYTGAGTKNALTVTIPVVATPPAPSGPTGTVFNSNAAEFLVAGSPANFIFATLDGTIAARTSVSNTAAVTVATVPGAVFTGLALANDGTSDFLYAPDFRVGGTIHVFNTSFTPTTLAGTFTDPTLPVGYAPYNIQQVGGSMFVTYAVVGTKGATTGAGLGILSIFDQDGNFLTRLVSPGGVLNAPWGMTQASAGFGKFSNAFLIGNFGDGVINAFSSFDGSFIGKVSDTTGTAIANPGLWAINFGNGNAGSTPDTLFFNAGINNEADGLFGSIILPNTLTFPGQLVGTLSGAQTVMVKNTGTSNLILGATALALPVGDFAIAPVGTTCTNNLTITPGSTCNILITFTPGAAGARGPVNLTITDNASPGTQTLVLSGTGTLATPSVTLSPSTVPAFAGQLVGTTSTTTQVVTVTNSGTAPLVFGASAITFTGTNSGDFTQTNTCNNQSIAITLNCKVTVSFAPTASGSRTAALSIADNATGSPQTMNLSGTGQDFSVSVSTPTAVTAGSSTTATVTVGALGGFTGAVTITCTGTIPQGSCVAPTTAVTAPGTATITFMTSALVGPPPSSDRPPTSIRQIVFIASIFGLLCVLFSMQRTRTRLGLAGAMLILVFVAGCGTSSTTSTTRTPAGSYPVTVTGTSGGVSRTASVTLTVN